MQSSAINGNQVTCSCGAKQTLFPTPATQAEGSLFMGGGERGGGGGDEGGDEGGDAGGNEGGSEGGKKGGSGGGGGDDGG